MKHIRYLFTLLSIMPFICMAQTKTQNYVMTETMLNADATNSQKSVQYYNGLGYPTLISTIGANGNSINTMTTYDGSGREKYKYMPVPGSDMSYADEDKIQSSAKDFYKENRCSIYNAYDCLNRKIYVEQAGDAWAGKGDTIIYSSNSRNEVLHYETSIGQSSGLILPEDASYEYYPENTLTKETHIDADGKRNEIFKDFQGRIILERSSIGNTYYVYNPLGQLRFVLSPKFGASGNKNLNGYEYRYDTLGRIYKKILPGCGTTQYWYDYADRMSYMKDPSLGDRYRFYLYDEFGRLCVQGTCNEKSKRSSDINSTTTYLGGKKGVCQSGYSIPYSIYEPKLEIVNYYDKYNFIDYDNDNTIASVSIDTTKTYSNGYQTGQVVYATNGEVLKSIYVYDNKSHIVRSLRTTLNGYVENISTKYTYTGKPCEIVDSIIEGIGGNKFIAHSNTFYNSYNDQIDHNDISLNYGTGDYTTSTWYKYDDINRIESKNFNDIDTVCYSYDIHGWVTQIKAKSFAENLYYADGNGTKYYNGNISSYTWQNINNPIKGYKLTYDGANRLVNAIYGEGADLSNNINNYNEKVSYDKNGNITSLQRYGLLQNGKQHGIIDNLTMKYPNGNQLAQVRDNAAQISYAGAVDFNGTPKKYYNLDYYSSGSLKYDESRGIANIQYDELNNPIRIQFTNGNVTKYVYSATGEKLRVIYQTAVPNISVDIDSIHDLTSNEVLYADSIDYLLGGALTLKNSCIDKFYFDGGYAQAEYAGTDCKPMTFISFDDEEDIVINSSSLLRPTSRYSFKFNYYNQDHLGNNREVVDENGEIVQSIDYYPFGMQYCDGNTGSEIQSHKYNGKEFDKMHGLNTYDYGARQYNPVTARWDRMDPLCEKYYSVSPYAYCANNPVNAIDPDGNFTVFINGFKNNPCGSLKGYWEDHDIDFDKYFHQDHKKAIYRDGSLGGSASWLTFIFSGELNTNPRIRYKYGYQQGRADVIKLLSSLERNSDGTIIEPLILATHSMGGQYGKGYAQAIMDYYNKYRDRYQGFYMLEIDIAPFQAKEQNSITGVTTIQVHDINDGIAPISKIKGATLYKVNSGENKCSSHFISNNAFWEQIKKLSEGSYRVINGQIIPQ